MQTIDGKICDICDDGYFFDLENNCVDTNFCEKGYKSGIAKNALKDIFFQILINLAQTMKIVF